MLSRAVNDHLSRLIGIRVTRARELARAEQAERRAEQAERRAEQAERQAEQLAKQVELLEAKFKPLTNSPVVSKRIALLGRLLLPQQAEGIRKVRLGGPHDGGYVCLDDFNDIAAAMSLGVGQDASWDADVAERGLIVYQYDHTVEGPPIAHVNFRFNRRNIAANVDRKGESIESVLAHICPTRPASVIMKMDIEHDEWGVFAATTGNALNAFAQVICEFHGFDKIIDDQWFERALAVLSKLNDRFAVVHVHANNFTPLLAIGNLLFPQTLEVTYASRTRYTFRDADATFPGELDAPNSPIAADHGLGGFIY